MAIDVNNMVQFYTGAALPADAVSHPNRVYFITANGVGSLYKGNTLIAQTNNDSTIKDIQSNIEALDQELDNHVALYNALVKTVQTNTGNITTNANAIAGIKNGTSINDFATVESALAGKQAVGDYATKAQAKGYADAKDADIAAAQKAGDDAQTAADDAQADVDDLKEYVGTIPTGATSTNIADWVVERTSGIATEGAMSALTDRVTQAEKDIDAVEAKLEGVESKVTTSIADAVAVEKQRAESVEQGLRTDVDLKAAQTDLTAEVNRAKAAEEALDDRLVEVETFFKTAEGETLDTALDTLVEIQKYITDEGAAADEMVKDIAANAEAIEALEAKFGEGEGTVSDMISDAVAAEKAAREAAIEAVQEDADKGIADAAKAQAAAEAADTKAQTAQNEVDALELVVAEKATQADLTSLTNRVTTAEGKITTLEGEMDAVEAKAAKNETDIATANAAIATKAAQADLESLLDALEWHQA